MEFRKNDIVTLEIVDCGTDGEGIGKADGFTVFVKDAVIGDTVTAKIMKAKKNYGYGRLMEILNASPYRVEPVCPSIALFIFRTVMSGFLLLFFFIAQRNASDFQ